jgi:hypothetical protein
MEEDLLLEKRLDALRIQHKELDNMIDALSKEDYLDELRIRRLKKEKLALRDKILRIEDELYPDDAA